LTLNSKPSSPDLNPKSFIPDTDTDKHKKHRHTRCDDRWEEEEEEALVSARSAAALQSFFFCKVFFLLGGGGDGKRSLCRSVAELFRV
jgi:hypothetical protein